MKKVLTIIGARPQFIKASVVSKEIQKTDDLEEILVHTGQHFDENMSDVFFNQLSIPRPDYRLDINGGSHGSMTGRMLVEIEKVIQKEIPDWVLVYGDTNSTLAGALAASKLQVPLAHVEAGLRSFNMQMPEEINRIVTDRLSDILFCPTDAAVSNLESESFPFVTGRGIKQRIFQVGDVMQDSALFFARQACMPAGLKECEGYILATLHRAENTDNPLRLAAIVDSLNALHKDTAPVVLPLHPRTRKVISKLGLKLNVTVIEPVGYFEMIGLLQNAGLVLTDSGGVQKEAYFFGKACVTLRDQTEWTELLELGANVLVGADSSKILAAARANLGRVVSDENQLYGGGHASARISNILRG